jgi:hypothetical protein
MHSFPLARDLFYAKPLPIFYLFGGLLSFFLVALIDLSFPLLRPVHGSL